MEKRTFEHFPKQDVCLICGTNKDKKGAYVAVAGTQEANSVQLSPVHSDCFKSKITEAIWFKDKDVIAFPAAKADQPEPKTNGTKH